MGKSLVADSGSARPSLGSKAWTQRRLDLSRRLRANPAWDLVPLDRLPPSDRARLDATIAPDTYGVLISSHRSGAVKLVGPDTALLFLTLREPMSMPSWVRAAFGSDADDAVAELVAEDILRVEVNGAWVGGARAFRASATARSETRGNPASISLRALRMAVALNSRNENAVASFLYRYGTTPMTPARARVWSHADAIRADLRLDGIGPPVSLSDNRAWWLFAGTSALGPGPSPKLYAGIALDALAEALARIGVLWHQHRATAPAFKIGASARELHRPDRLVFYPPSPGDATLWGERLAEAFAGLPADPVPFTAALDKSGSVSLGADPPHTGPAWRSEEASWRGMVTRLLAGALIAASESRDPEPWSYALERARLAGIDPRSWVPVDGWWTLWT